MWGNVRMNHAHKGHHSPDRLVELVKIAAAARGDAQKRW